MAINVINPNILPNEGSPTCPCVCTDSRQTIAHGHSQQTPKTPTYFNTSRLWSRSQSANRMPVSSVSFDKEGGDWPQFAQACRLGWVISPSIFWTRGSKHPQCARLAGTGKGPLLRYRYLVCEVLLSSIRFPLHDTA